MLRLGPPNQVHRAIYGDLVAHKHFRAFLRFHRDNPMVYVELVKLARHTKNRGQDKAGIRMLWEVLRWNIMIRTVDLESDFKLNDHYHSFYSRLIMRMEKDLVGFFELRKQKG